MTTIEFILQALTLLGAAIAYRRLERRLERRCQRLSRRCTRLSKRCDGSDDLVMHLIRNVEDLRDEVGEEEDVDVSVECECARCEVMRGRRWN